MEKLVNAPQQLTDIDTAAALIYLEMQRLRVPRQGEHAKQLLRSVLMRLAPEDVRESILDGQFTLTIKDHFRLDAMRMLLGRLYPWFGKMEWNAITAKTC